MLRVRVLLCSHQREDVLLCASLCALAAWMGAVPRAWALPHYPMGISSLTAASQLQDAENHSPGLPDCQEKSNHCECKSQ